MNIFYQPYFQYRVTSFNEGVRTFDRIYKRFAESTINYFYLFEYHRKIVLPNSLSISS